MNRNSSIGSIAHSRDTAETQITIGISLGTRTGGAIATQLPFFDHLLHAASFHGRLGLSVEAKGDIEVDAHHLVEDVGITLGQAVRKLQEARPAIVRFGSAAVPMDDALSEAVVDLSNRAYLVYKATWPQSYAGEFQVALLREFFHGLAQGACANLHLHCRYGLNSHHQAEALFKAVGIALGIALTPSDREDANAIPSTKGVL